MYRFGDTITAVSTPPGEGGIGIIRMSGPDALSIASRLFNGPTGGGFTSHRFLYGEIRDPVSSERVDEVLVVAMIGPHSYTREDVVEIHCHGGSLIVQKILGLTLSLGARLAAPGEFTQRAFLSGRIDLVQAEAVIDMIRAKTEAALSLANRQEAGELASVFSEIQLSLQGTAALVEAYIDFPDDDLDTLDIATISTSLSSCRKSIAQLIQGADYGRILREGVTVSLIGRPNVGKSSLLNALLREKRAIVTNIPGTTRDIIEESVSLRGLPVRLLDTAGIRESDDPIEREGVSLSRSRIASSDLVIFLVDSSVPFTPDDEAILSTLASMPYLTVLTKCDLPLVVTLPTTIPSDRVICLSTTTSFGMDHLRDSIYDAFLSGWASDSREHCVLTHARQKDALVQAGAALGRAQAGISQNSDLSLVAADIREALNSLGQVTGETAPDTILDLIFSRFCIGK